MSADHPADKGLRAHASFPLSRPSHLARLRNWGFTFIRFVVPWEALEHAGPGVYDEDYFSYLHELVSFFLPRFGMKCYIDAHQDVWSRHTGGSGAPTWTMQLVGLDIRSFKATGAAQAQNLHLDPERDPPAKNWPSGMTKLAAAVGRTVFVRTGNVKAHSRAFFRPWRPFSGAAIFSPGGGKSRGGYTRENSVNARLATNSSLCRSSCKRA